MVGEHDKLTEVLDSSQQGDQKGAVPSAREAKLAEATPRTSAYLSICPKMAQINTLDGEDFPGQ